MVADLFSLLAQTASPKGKPGKNERQPWRWIGQSGEKVGAAVGADLFSLLAQTASPKGEAEKRRIAQCASTERKTEKGRKTAEALDRAKPRKGWCGGWSRPLQSACADSFPEGGSRERANCAERFYKEESRERAKDSRGVGKGKAGKRLVRRLGQTSSVCLRRQLPRRGKPR